MNRANQGIKGDGKNPPRLMPAVGFQRVEIKTMPEFMEFPKGKIKRTGNFYGWAFVAVMFLIIGVRTLFTGHFQYRSSIAPFEGGSAYLFGGMLVCFSIYFLYYLFVKAEKYEKGLTDFHQLDNFDDMIEGHKTSFKIEHTALPSHKGGAISVFFYKLKIEFNKKLVIRLNIRRRDKFEYFLWVIGLNRFFDILTDNYYFDSKYRIKTDNKLLLKKLLNQKTIKLLEEFDRDYPPIRNKNGILIINETSIRYTEGPYSEDQRLFDPHRGIIEKLFRELLKIVKAIEVE